MRGWVKSRWLTLAVFALAVVWLLYRLDLLAGGFDRDNLKLELYADGRLFLLEKAQSRDIYVFGTVTLNNPEVLELPESVLTALANAPVFATDALSVPSRASDGAQSEADATYMRQLAGLCFRPSQFSLRSQIGAERFDSAAARLLALLDDVRMELEPLGLAEQETWTLADIDRLTLPCLASMLSRSPSQWVRSSLHIETLDQRILTLAADENKAVVHLASFQELYDHLAEMDEPLGLEYLRLALDCYGYATIQEYEESLAEAYRQGGLNRLPWLGPSSERFEDFARTSIANLSRTMVERVLDLPGQEALFFAVNAIHLNGEEGVLNLLAREGYSVTALEPPT